jgi:short-subunit dehydrogenase
MRKELAVITGASGGIGRSYARQLAARDYDLILSGRRRDVLNELAEEIKSAYHVGVEVRTADLSDEQSLLQFASYLQSFAKPDMLIHSAGFGSLDEFLKEDVTRQLEMVRVHISATIQLMHAVIPAMMERHSGAVIVVSSLGAFFPAPQSSLYAGTKAFLNAFMESVHMEFQNTGISLQCLCPGFTRTNFQKKSAFLKTIRSWPFLWMNSDEVVETSLKQLNNGKVLCIPGTGNRMLKWFINFINRGFIYSLTERCYKRYLSANSIS